MFEEEQMKLIDFKTSGFRALRLMHRAIRRGDHKEAVAWALVAERQLRFARRISDLYAARHRPKPLRPLPPAPPPPSPPAKRSRARNPAPIAVNPPARWPNRPNGPL